MLKALVISAPVGAIAYTSNAVREVVIEPAAVMLNLRVHGREQGQFFEMTLVRKPWPVVGERIRFDYQTFHLVGTVETTEAEPWKYSDRILYHLVGHVIEFRGEPPHRG